MNRTEVITWHDASTSLPDADTNVLLDAGDLGVFEGFLDGTDDAGAPIWRDVTAAPVSGVTDWARMPNGANRGPMLVVNGAEAVSLAETWRLPTC